MQTSNIEHSTSNIEPPIQPSTAERRKKSWLRSIVLCLLGFFVLTSVPGCARHNLRVGAKNFSEQIILAEMTVQLLRARGWSVDPVVVYEDTFDIQRALRDGQIDLVVEYSGTGLLFLGDAMTEPATLDRARELYKPLGLDWQGPLGFDNHYTILMRAERAANLGINTISDLKKLPGAKVRFACQPSYIRRPRDGMMALCERYELTPAQDPLLLGDVIDRVEALRDGRVDIVVAAATDPVLSSDLVVLEDDQKFFPSYQAAFLVREERIKADPVIVDVLGALDGKLDAEAMRRLNHEVDVEGRRPVDVARAFLRNHELLDGDEGPKERLPEIVVALDEEDQLDSFETITSRAVREAFPERTVVIKTVPDPVERVAAGEARLALLGAERFFVSSRAGVPRRVQGLEALAVVGKRELHIVRRADDINEEKPLAGKIGIPPARSGAGIVARAMLEDQTPAAEVDAGELLEQVASGQLDVAIILAPPGAAEIARPLAAGKLALNPLTSWFNSERRARLPYLRPASIQAKTYANQPESVRTLGTQVVIAGAMRGTPSVASGAGPAAALPMVGLPLTDQQIRSLSAGTHFSEAPDPVLPSAWTAAPHARQAKDSLFDDSIKTILNVLAITFLVWLFIVVRRPGPETTTTEPA